MQAGSCVDLGAVLLPCTPQVGPAGTDQLLSSWLEGEAARDAAEAGAATQPNLPLFGLGPTLPSRPPAVQWFDSAAPSVAEACRTALGLLEGAGLEVVPLELPELALLRAAHSCTIASEMKNNLDCERTRVLGWGTGGGWVGLVRRIAPGGR